MRRAQNLVLSQQVLLEGGIPSLWIVLIQIKSHIEDNQTLPTTSSLGKFSVFLTIDKPSGIKSAFLKLHTPISLLVKVTTPAPICTSAVWWHAASAVPSIGHG